MKGSKVSRHLKQSRSTLNYEVFHPKKQNKHKSQTHSSHTIHVKIKSSKNISTIKKTSLSYHSTSPSTVY